MHESSKSNYFDKAVNILLLLLPILQIYGWGGMYNFGVLATSLCVVLFLLKYGLCNSLPKWLTVYFGYCILIYLIYAEGGVSSYVPLAILYPIFAYMMFFKCVDLKTISKYYRIIAAVCIAFFYFQEVSYYMTGHRIGGVIQALPLALNVDDVATYYDTIESASRSSSFFSEPAHFVQFLMPLLALLLFERGRKNYLFIFVILLTLLLLQSGNALFGLAAMGFVYILKILFNADIKSKVAGVVALAIAVVGINALFLRSDMGEGLLERQDELNSDIEMSSGFIRIYRGYYVFETYNTLEQIFGINGKSGIENKIRQSKVAYMFEDNDLYFNVVQSILIRTGYLGALLFLIMLLSLWKGNDYRGKAILLVLVVLSFIASMYLTMGMALYLVLAYKVQQENLLRKKMSGNRVLTSNN